MAGTEFSHNIPRRIWTESGRQLRELGLRESHFGIVDNYWRPGTKNVTELPQLGKLNGPSGHFGWDDAHATQWQAVREYLDNVFQQQKDGGPRRQSLAQISALRRGLADAAKAGELALSLRDEKFKGWSGEQFLQRNRDIVAKIGTQHGVVPNLNLGPISNSQTGKLAQSGQLLRTFNSLGQVGAKLGVVGAILGVGITGAQAAGQFANNDVRGGTKTLAGFAGGFVGGLLAGAAAGAIVGTALGGPIGTIVGGVIGLGAGIVGGMVGEGAANSAFDQLWTEPTSNADAGRKFVFAPDLVSRLKGDAPVTFSAPDKTVWTITPGNQGYHFQSSTGEDFYNNRGWQSAPGVRTPPDGQVDIYGSSSSILQNGINSSTSQQLASGFLDQWMSSSLDLGGLDVDLLNGLNPVAIDPSPMNQKIYDNLPFMQRVLLSQSIGLEGVSFARALATPGVFMPPSIVITEVIGYGKDERSYGAPVLLDLTGNGINITQFSSSNTWFDTAGDGYQHRTAWAGAGNGVLVYDTNGDGKITQANQINFTLWDPTANSDMEALRGVFDSNHDGKLDAGDANFAKFKVLVSNADGTQSLLSLADLGIVSINLVESAASIVLQDGSSIDGTTTYTRTDGTTGQAATVTLVSDALGYKVNQTTTHNADGSTTIANKAFNPDGSLASETITLTSADGKTRTLSFDVDGDGVIDRIQTDVFSTGANGAIVETLSNYSGASLASAYLVDRVVTTTTSIAGVKTVSIDRDADADGVIDQNETQVTSASGVSTVTITNYNPNGTIASQATKTLAADGLSRTDAVDVDGNGIVDLTSTDVTVINSDQSRTETVSEWNSDGTLRDRTVTTSSANGASKTVTYDYDGDGVIDQTRSLVLAAAADGSSVTIQKDTNYDGTLIGASQKTISADGLSIVTMTDSFGATDANGNPIYDVKTSDVTVVNADHSRTQTLASYVYANGTPKLVGQTEITKGADGITRTTKINRNGALDANGNPIWNSIETVAVDAAHGNNVVNTLKVFNPNGTMSSAVVTTTSADGRTITVQSNQGGNVDANGNLIFDHVQTSVTSNNADGSSTVVTRNMAGDGQTIVDTTTTTTSADGLTVTTTSNRGGLATNTRDTITINADGSREELIQVTAPGAGANPIPVVLSTTEVGISSDKKTAIAKEDTNGDGAIDRVTSHFVRASGATVDVVSSFARDGSLIAKSETVTSADGLAITTTSSIGDEVVGITTDVVVLNIDGSKTETVTKRAADGTLISQAVTTTSDDGFSQTSTTSIDGKVDSTTTDVSVIAGNGDLIDTVTFYDAAGVKIKATQTTSSANGRLTTTSVDADGDGTFDLRTTDEITLNMTDGSVTEVVTTQTLGATPDILGRTQIYTSADALTVITSVDNTGEGVFDEVTKVVEDGAGNVVTTIDRYDPQNRKVNEVVTIENANGLYSRIETDVNGDGVFDRTQISSAVLNQDGSRTQTTTNLVGATTVGTSVVTTSANGTEVTERQYLNGQTSGSLTRTNQSSTVYNLDGSTTKTSTVKNRSGGIVSQSTAQISADRATTTIEANFLQTIFGSNRSGRPASSLETISVLADGSVRDNVNYYASATASGALLASKTSVASANGLSKTLSWDLNGDGTIDGLQSTIIALGADGTTTKTFTETNAFPGTNFTQDVGVTTVTSANGLTNTILASIKMGDGWSTVNGSSRQFINSDGSVTTVIENAVQISHRMQGGNYVTVQSGSDAAVITKSRDGLTTTTEISTWGNDVFYRTDKVTTHLDGSTTQTIRNLHDNETLGQLKTITVSADTRTITINDYVSQNGFTNYAVQTTVPTYASNGNAISLTTSSNYRNHGGVLLNTQTQSTSLDGLSKTTTMDTNGDGIIDHIKTDVITLRQDGTSSEVITQVDALGAQIKQQVLTTSADGLNRIVTISGSGGILATTRSDTIHGADGSTITTAITTSPGVAGATIVRNRTDIETSADGRGTYVTWDLDGDGLKDATESAVADLSGAKTVTDTYYLSDGVTVSSTTTTTTSADGRMTTVSRTIAASPSSNTTETTIWSADGSGSYLWVSRDASGNELIYANHTIDQNGIDYIDLRVNGVQRTYRISVDQEAQNLAQVQAIYTVLLGRTMGSEEMQTWLKYYTIGGLDAVQLAKDLMNSTEFWQSYGGPLLDAGALIAAVYENAYGRSASGAEINFWVSRLPSQLQYSGGRYYIVPDEAARAAFVIDMARIANPAGVPNAGFNLQASSPYPLPFGAGGGAGGGVPNSITTFSSTYGTIVEHYDPLTGFLERTEYYDGSLNYLTDYFDPVSGKISKESGYFYNQSGTQITNAYVTQGRDITIYAPIAHSDLLNTTNVVLGITNNADGSSTWRYYDPMINFTAPLYRYATVDYYGATSIQRLANPAISAQGYMSHSKIYDLNTGYYTEKTAQGAGAGVPGYRVVEFGNNRVLAQGTDNSGRQGSAFTFYDATRQLAPFFTNIAEIVSTYAITSIYYESTGPDGSGLITYSSATSSQYSSSLFNGFLNNYTISISPFYRMLSEYLGIIANTQYSIPIAPGTGPETGSSNFPLTPGGGFSFTPEMLTPPVHLIDTQAGYVRGTGGDTFIYNAGYGLVEIDENDPSASPMNILRLGSTISSASIVVTADSSGNLYIRDGVTADVIKIAGMLSDTSRGVQVVEFLNDNTTWTRAQLLQAAATGTAGADMLYGTSGAETFDGKGGNDFASGSGGGDTFVYASGYGVLEIDEHDVSASPNNVLRLIGINSADVTIVSDGTNLYLTHGVAGDLIKIDNMVSGENFGIQLIEFTDTSWNRSDILSRAQAPVLGSSTRSDVLLGTSGADYLDGRGAPVGQTDVIVGQGGNDVIIYNRGYGALEIREYGASANHSVLKLGAGISLQTVTIQADEAGNLILTDGVAGDEITIKDYVSSAASGPQVIQFADGTSLTKAEIIETFVDLIPDFVSSGTEDTVITLAAEDVLANIEGAQALTSVSATSAKGAVVSLVNGSVVYDPRSSVQLQALGEGQTETDTFVYTVSYANGITLRGTVTMNITGINDAPIAQDDVGLAVEGGEPVTLLASTLLGNDTDPDAGETKSLVSVSANSDQGASVRIVNGNVVYDPMELFQNLGAGQTAIDSFTYTMRDAAGLTSTATVRMTITGTNDAPIAVDDTGATDQNTVAALSVDGLLANDNDVDAGDTKQLVSVSATSARGAQVELVNGSVLYDPGQLFRSLGAGHSTTDTFTYTMRDAAGAISTATVTMTITGINDGPLAVNDSASTSYDRPVTVNVLANDSDIDVGDVLTTSLVSGPGHGSLLRNADGTFTYTPAGGYTGTDQFTYQISDGQGGTATATVTLTVTARTVAGTPGNDTLSGGIGPDILIGGAGDDIYIIDQVGDLIVEQPGEGTDTVRTSLASYTLGENLENLTSTSTANFTGIGNSAANIITGGSGNDRLVGGAGADVLNGGAGIDVADYAASQAGVSVDLETGQGSGGDAQGDLLTGIEALIGSVYDDSLAGDGGANDLQGGDGDDVLIGRGGDDVIDGGAGRDTAVFTGNAADYVITVAGGVTTVRDTVVGRDGTDTLTRVELLRFADQTIVVNAVPVAHDDAAAADQNVVTTIAAASLLANDTDEDAADTKELVSVSAMSAKGASVSIVNGNVVYDARAAAELRALAAGQTVSDTFTYTMRDTLGATSTATVTVLVTGVNDAPQALADTANTAEDSGAITLTAASLLANDTDVDTGDTKTLVSVAATSAKGAAVSIIDGNVVYDPGALFQELGQGHTTTDTFTYTMRDAAGATSTATVTVTIIGTNDAPVAQGDSYVLAEDDVLEIAAASLLANDLDVEGDALTVIAVADPQHGTVSLDQGVIRFIPAANFNGPASFSYTISDGNGGYATGQVTINVMAENSPPVLSGAAAQLEAALVGATYIVHSDDLLQGWTDADGDILAIANLSVDHGAVIDNGDGTFTITLETGYIGNVAISYSIADGRGGISAAVRTFEVKEEPAVTGEFLVNTTTDNAQTMSSVATLSDGNFVVVWMILAAGGGAYGADIYGQMFNAAGQRIGAEFVVNSIRAGAQSAPDVVALADGGFVVAWQSLVVPADGMGLDTKSRVFSANGNAVGSESLVNTYTNGSQVMPAIGSLTNGGYVIVWQDASGTLGDTVPGAIKAQLYDSAGGKTGSEFLVNTQTAGSQVTPDVVGLSNGGFVIVWQDAGSFSLGDPSASIKAQVFNANGAKVGSEFLVNTATANAQSVPSVTALVNGNFVVTWQDASGTLGDPDGSIKGQIFNPSGVKVGSEFLVNTATLGVQAAPTITSLVGGGFVITWSDPSGTLGDNSSTSIKAQVFNSVGTKLGVEFLVNMEGAGAQTVPTIAALNDGGFVISWTDASGTMGDASSTSVKARIFHGAAPVAYDDAAAADQNVVTTIAAASLLANDTAGYTGDTKTLVSVSAMSAKGASVNIVDGNVVYDARAAAELRALAAGQTASDTFTYTMRDTFGATSTATVTVLVTGVNDAPQAMADTAYAVEDGGAITLIAASLLANDTDVDTGDTKTLVSVAPTSAKGAAVSIIDGNVVYDPGALFQELGQGQTTTDTFTYTMRDTAGATSTATVTVTISGTNDAPVAQADNYVLAENDVLEITAASLLANDLDVEGDALTVVAVADAQHGTVSLDQGVIRFVPAANYNGPASFTYTISDGHGGYATGQVSVNVTGNSPPVLSGNTVQLGSAFVGETYIVRSVDLLQGWSDADGDVLEISGLNADHGTVTSNGDGTYTVVLDAGYVGNVNLSYSIVDGRGGLAVAQQTFEVKAEVAVSSEFLVNTVTENVQASSATATLANGNVIVVWQDLSDGLFNIKAQILSAGGQKIGGEVLVSSSPQGTKANPDVIALSSGGFTVTWQGVEVPADGNLLNIKSRVFSVDGVAIGSDFLVNTYVTGAQVVPAAAELAGGGFVIVWQDSSSTLGDTVPLAIKAQLFDDAGDKIGSEFLVNTQTAGSQTSPDVVELSGGGFVVVWHDYTSFSLGDPSASIKAQIFSGSGAKVGGEFLVNTFTAGAQESPSTTALSNGNFVVTWQDASGSLGDLDGSIKGQIFSSVGAKIGSEFLVNSATSGKPLTPAIVALVGGGFVVTWSDPSGTLGDNSSSSIKAQVFNDSGDRIGEEFLVNEETAGAQSAPSVSALDDGGFIISWTDASGTMGDASGTSIKARIFHGSELEAMTTSFAQGRQAPETRAEGLSLADIAAIEYSSFATFDNGLSGERIDESAAFFTRPADDSWKAGGGGANDGLSRFIDAMATFDPRYGNTANGMVADQISAAAFGGTDATALAPLATCQQHAA